MFTSEVRVSLFSVQFTKGNILLWGRGAIGLQLVIKDRDILTSEFLYNTLYSVCDTLENWDLGNKHSCRFSGHFYDLSNKDSFIYNYIVLCHWPSSMKLAG